MKLALVIPVYNESGNILPLIQSFKEKRTTDSPCPFELILVNNGSRDGSADELIAARGNHSWIKIITIKANVGYGGGIQKGFEFVSPVVTHIGWMPADLQYSIEDLQKVWKEVLLNPKAVHKGIRTVRMDGNQTQIVSRIYTSLARNILDLKVEDINGLPKIFPARMIERVDFKLAESFHLDGQLMLAARLFGLEIKEHPVTFYARRAGVSSWSSKRMKVYAETILALLAMRSDCKRWFTTNYSSPSRAARP